MPRIGWRATNWVPGFGAGLPSPEQGAEDEEAVTIYLSAGAQGRLQSLCGLIYRRNVKGNLCAIKMLQSYVYRYSKFARLLFLDPFAAAGVALPAILSYRNGE